MLWFIRMTLTQPAQTYASYGKPAKRNTALLRPPPQRDENDSGRQAASMCAPTGRKRPACPTVGKGARLGKSDGRLAKRFGRCNRGRLYPVMNIPLPTEV